MDAPTAPPIAHVQLDRTRQAAPQVFERLREQILWTVRPPGAMLSRRALQQEFGLSQTPIRDALGRLAEEGLVDVFPQHATRVSLIDPAAARQAHFLRVAIELELIGTLAPASPPALLAQLHARLAEQEALAAAGAYELFMASDQQFHQALYLAAGMAELRTLVCARSGHVDRLRRLNLPDPGKADAVLRDHRRIVAALDAGDAEAAREAMRTHLSGTLKIMDRIRARYPHYFVE